MAESITGFLLHNLKITSRLGFEWQALCPYHEDKTPSFSINVHKKLFICYACGVKGNMSQLLDHLGYNKTLVDEELSPDDVLQKTRELSKSLRDTRAMVGVKLPAHWFSDSTAIAGYWTVKRYLTKETIEKFGLGRDTIENHAIIPVRAMNGTTIGSIRRVLDKDSSMRYLYSRGMKTSNYLFGADVAKSMMHKNKDSRLVITEGAVDAMTFTSYFNIPAVALFGSRMSVAQAEQLKKLGAENIFIATDMDRAGRMASVQVEELIRNTRTGAILTQLYWRNAKDMNELIGKFVKNADIEIEKELSRLSDILNGKVQN
jgi:DNA primase